MEAAESSAECSGASIHIRHLCLAPPGSSLYTYWIGFFPVIAYNQFSKILTHIVHFVKLFFLPALLRYKPFMIMSQYTTNELVPDVV